MAQLNESNMTKTPFSSASKKTPVLQMYFSTSWESILWFMILSSKLVGSK